MATRYDSEETIALLQKEYPAAFFETPQLRRPLKTGIFEDIRADGFPVDRELLRAALDWYTSHYGYQYALRAGARRIDLKGNEVGTVTLAEQATALKEIQRIKEMRKVSHNPAPAVPAPASASVPRFVPARPEGAMAAALALIAQAKAGFGAALTDAAAQMRANFFMPGTEDIYGAMVEDLDTCLRTMEQLGRTLDPPAAQAAEAAE